VNPGEAAVVAWSKRIHDLGGDRHAWACRAARTLAALGPDAQLPPFPSRLRTTQESRDETVRRIYRQAMPV
jgi:hypothetical protein